MDISLAFNIDGVIEIKLINARYKWVWIPEPFFFRLWFSIGFITKV